MNADILTCDSRPLCVCWGAYCCNQIGFKANVVYGHSQLNRYLNHSHASQQLLIDMLSLE